MTLGLNPGPSAASPLSKEPLEQTLEPLDTEAVIQRAATVEDSPKEQSGEQSDLAVRKLAIKARTESNVTALITVITAPLDERELTTQDMGVAVMDQPIEG